MDLSANKCKLPELHIGNKIARLPIIQGGMGVGVSLSSLAGAVAKEGGVGIISTAQIGYDDDAFEYDQAGCNLAAIKNHIRKAKEIAGGNGLVGVNIMVALKHYKEHVKAAVAAGADVIISGAGLPIDLPALVDKACQTKIAPIVSSKRATQLILKMWSHNYDRTADFIVIEGPKAGGHLGFSNEQLNNTRQEDVQIIQSPVGMPGRALRNAFIKQLDNSRIPISKCYNCLEKCNPAKVPYCITKALINAVKGDVDNGLIFCGANVGRINEITTVHSLMKELTE